MRWDALLSIKAGREGLLSAPTMPDIVDFLWKPLPVGRGGRKVAWKGGKGRAGEGRTVVGQKGEILKNK